MGGTHKKIGFRVSCILRLLAQMNPICGVHPVRTILVCCWTDGRMITLAFYSQKSPVFIGVRSSHKVPLTVNSITVFGDVVYLVTTPMTQGWTTTCLRSLSLSQHGEEEEYNLHREVCAQNQRYNFAFPLRSSSLPNHCGQLSFCFYYLPTNNSLALTSVVTVCVHLLTQQPPIILPTYLTYPCRVG